MKSFIDTMVKLFNSLYEHPERRQEIAELIKHKLNDSFPNTCCKKVFISDGNDYKPFIVNVIPNVPSKNILTVENISDYDIDIDINSFIDNYNYNGVDAEEMVIWLYHELLANVITNETLLRYKKLLIKYYDVNNSSIMDTIKVFGKLLWIGIFSRTNKEYINEDSDNSNINTYILDIDCQSIWNAALAKYICINGGTPDIISAAYTNRHDRAQLREFNELARKYSTYVLKYNNTDYSTMIKYIINSTKSQLVKYYCEKEPNQMIVFKEKDSFNLFDDRRLLTESADEETVSTLDATRSSADLQHEYNDIEIDINNIENESDKLRVAVRIRDLIVAISDRILENRTYDTEQLSLLREKANVLSDKLSKINTDKQLSVIELDASIL